MLQPGKRKVWELLLKEAPQVLVVAASIQLHLVRGGLVARVARGHGAADGRAHIRSPWAGLHVLFTRFVCLESLE